MVKEVPVVVSELHVAYFIIESWAVNAISLSFLIQLLRLRRQFRLPLRCAKPPSLEVIF